MFKYLIQKTHRKTLLHEKVSHRTESVALKYNTILKYYKTKMIIHIHVYMYNIIIDDINININIMPSQR